MANKSKNLIPLIIGAKIKMEVEEKVKVEF